MRRGAAEEETLFRWDETEEDLERGRKRGGEDTGSEG